MSYQKASIKIFFTSGMLEVSSIILIRKKGSKYLNKIKTFCDFYSEIPSTEGWL